MKILLKIFTFLILSAFSKILLAETHTGNGGPQTFEQLKAAIEDIRKNTNTPAVGIALVNKDGPYWVAGLGEANLEEHINADENTMFRIGSISKMFVALSVLKLVEEGKLHLTDEVHYLVPDIKFDNKWEKTNPILLVHLLEHTTGWDDFHLAETSYKATDSSSLKDALNFHPDSRTSRWVPGTRYAYSNIGPAVSAYIVEKITGKKFEDYIQQNFFNPLQMSSSTFYQSETYKTHAATLYMNNTKIDYSYPIYRPSGSMNSSAKDMANLLYFFIQRGKFNGNTLLTSSSIDRMETPKTNLGAIQGITAGYGLHNVSSGFKDYGTTLRGHTGGIPGALSSLQYIPELQIGYVVMTNTMGAGVWQITELINEFLLNQAKKPTPKPTKVASRLNLISGIYTPLNVDHEILRFVVDISDAIKVSVNNNLIHRSPITGGWESNDYIIAENLAVNPWSGLPSIAIAEDPIAGEALQIEEKLYKKTPAVIFYGKIILILLLAMLTLANLLFSFAWIPRSLRGKIHGSSLHIRAWPLASSMAIIISFLPIVTTHNLMKIGTLSPVSLTYFIGSLLYPIFTLFSLISLYKYRNEPQNKWVYLNAAILTVLHTLFVLYLANYGIIGYRSWAD